MRTMRIALQSAAAAAILAGTVFPALAGVIDSPVPSISASAATRVMFLAPGVINNNGIETAFMCTSIDSATATVAIEVFAPEGGAPLNNVATGSGNGAIAVGPGETVTIATGSIAGLHEDVVISGLTNVKNGSARILSTTTRLLCTAILVEDAGLTPASMASLKIFARRKQNGD